MSAGVVSTRSGLTVSATREEAQSLLRFQFEDQQNPESIWPLGLRYLGGDLVRESWQPEGPETEGQQSGLHSGLEAGLEWRQLGDYLAVSLVIDDPPESDPEERVRVAYHLLIDRIRALGFPELIRVWNYMPAINEGEADHERYRRFCSGRADALDALGIQAADLCACTAIGTDEPKLRVYVLAGRQPGLHIENPRQTSAYRYPRRYGPRSPSFARATAVPASQDQTTLMISGTASVVGHQTRHIGQVEAQAEEIVANIDALLTASAEQTGRDGLRRFNSSSLVRVYVREAQDWPRVDALFRRAWPEARLAGFRGDICRSNLLVEIEAVTQA